MFGFIRRHMRRRWLATNTNVAAIKAYTTAWSDQKIAEVYAFAQDGKLGYTNPCCCIIGVGSSGNLHTEFNSVACRNSLGGCLHYKFEREANPLAATAESAMLTLGFGLGMRGRESLDAQCSRLMAEILADVMRERETAGGVVLPVPRRTAEFQKA